MPFPKGRSQTLIERRWDSELGAYQWGRMEALKGQKKLWKDSTRDNALFLSTAIQLNCDQLKPVFDWFKYTLRIIGINGLSPNFTARMCRDQDVRATITKFLQSADLKITDIQVKSRQLEEKDIHFSKSTPDVVKEHIVNEIKSQETSSNKNSPTKRKMVPQ